MALASPGIQLFESSVTPATTVAAAENGVASLGYSTRGPVNKLTKISSVSEFNEVFGKPIADYPFAHIMGQAVLANGTDFYFMRLADSSAKKSSCPVVDYQPKGARVAIKDNTDAENATAGYFMASIKTAAGQPVTSLDRSAYLRVTVGNVVVDTEMQLAVGGIGYNDKTVIYTSVVNVINNLSKALPKFSFTAVNTDTEIGILVVAKNDTDYKDTALVFTVDVGSVESGAWKSWAADSDSVYKVTLNPTAVKEGTFKGETLSTQSTLADMGDIAAYNHFELVAKYPGSSMNGIRVTKDSTVSSIDSSVETWTVTVYDGESVVESRSGITADTFIEEMTKFEYIEITDEALGTGKDAWTWHDGSWDLGYGEVLSNGDHWTQEWDKPYVIIEGTDGYPVIKIGGQEQYDEDQSVNLYIEGLGSDEFVNTDEFSFSILATPGMQNTMVQNAAIDVCTTRGDAIFLADVPMQLCESKQLIDEVVEWANGNSGFQSSYCAIYYGWFAQTNPYDTANSIFCPASCFIAPKMAALDQSMGEFYAPAGIARGGVVCSDYIYSPDQKDRDKLVGNDNVVNPISYSNTRGVTIMAQKTTDRTTSPLNRVGIRRMTNMIKRKLKSQLVALLFEPNNETARSRARTIVDNVMSSLRSKECVESYDINVVSGTGANRNDLNVYLSFAPYGLIEKIYVYLNITDAGVETSETVA